MFPLKITGGQQVFKEILKGTVDHMKKIMENCKKIVLAGNFKLNVVFQADTIFLSPEQMALES